MLSLPCSVLRTALLAAAIWMVDAHPARAEAAQSSAEIQARGAFRVAATSFDLVQTSVDGKIVLANTTSVDIGEAATPQAAAVTSATVNSTILIFARDTASSYSAYSGLNSLGIPYQVVIVPQAGITLPVLNSSATVGNYGAIVVLSEVSYDYGTGLGFESALSTAQWATLYQYQVSFGVRMVRLDAFPGAAFGTTSLGGCCNGTEQLISLSSVTAFPTSGLKT